MSDGAEVQLGEPVEFGDGWQIARSDHASFDFPGLEGKPQLTYRLDFTHGEMVDPQQVLAILFGCVEKQEGVQHGQLYANGLDEERDVPAQTISKNIAGIQEFISAGMNFPVSDGFTLSSYTHGHNGEGLHATFAQAVLGEHAFLSVTVTKLPGHGDKVSDPVALLRNFTQLDALGGAEVAEETSGLEI